MDSIKIGTLDMTSVYDWVTKAILGSLYSVLLLYKQMWKIEMKVIIKPPHLSVDIKYHQWE
jgi:hypothetical protein